MVKIYTRTGDKGETALYGGARIAKNELRIEAYGTIDELNSFLGLARASWPGSAIDPELQQIQSDLFDIGAYLAAPGSDRFHSAPQSRIEELEQAIDRMEEQLTPLRSFILPGGSLAASNLHVARTVCRRAERLIVALEDRSTTLPYLNRLADYLFVAARFANLRHSVADTIWSGKG